MQFVYCSMPLSVLVCVLGSILWSTAGAQKIPLPFSYITSKTGIFVTAGAIPMVDLALELINNRTDILANYTLTYNNTIGDSNVNNKLICITNQNVYVVSYM